MVQITVFTPTYNRAYCLSKCYDSLKRQSNKNFMWLIVDDGSTDGTDDLVAGWQNQNNGFEIQYIWKENGGLHTGYNTAIANIETELCVCIDSDDFMPDNAIERILNFWNENGSDEYAGIVGLDYDLANHVIGDPLPDQKSINLIDLLVGRYQIKNGDRTNVVRTELYKQVAPMKVFQGEKNFNPHYMHLQISFEYDFLVLNENIRYVDYQDSGMTASMLRQYYSSPLSFAETRKLYLSFPDTSLKFRIRHAIHLNSSNFLAKKGFRGVSESPRPWLTAIMLPFGALLALYITCKNQGNKKVAGK